MVRKLTLLMLSLLFSCSLLSAESANDGQQDKLKSVLSDIEYHRGSNISLPVLTERKIENLALLGKVWGFLKYHHPGVASGQYNWDYELFRFFPRYQAVDNNQQRNALLSNWISGLGAVAICKACVATAKNAVIKPDLNWLGSYDLSPDLRQQLTFIYENRHQGKQHYVGTIFDVGNPEFLNENGYRDMTYPDDGYRLLALYRYWNMIHYFFPSKHLSDKNWRGVLEQYIPKFVIAKSQLEYQQVAVQLFSEIDDSHAYPNGVFAFQDWKGQKFPPVQLEFVQGKLVVVGHYKTELSNKTGLKTGDQITKIAGKTIEQVIRANQKFYPASNKARRLYNMSIDMMRSNDQSIKIHYVREGRNGELMLKLGEPDEVGFFSRFARDEQAKSFELIAGNIGYINLRHIKRKEIKVIKAKLPGTRGVIIDIRNYPRQFVAISLANLFSGTKKEFAKFTTVNINNPGEVVFSDAATISGSAQSYQNKVIVIVNEISQSQAEYTAMALQAGDNTTVIGSTTSGADGNISKIVLPGGIITAISGIGVYYPDGRQTQRIGIVPDVMIRPTISGIKAGTDELLEKAISLIESDR